MAAEDTRQPGDDHVRDDEAPDPALSAAWAALKSQRARAPEPGALDALETVVRPEATEAEREAALAAVLDGGQADGLALVHTLRDAARIAQSDASRVLTASPRGWARWRPTILATSSIAAVAAALVLVVRQTGPDSSDRQPIRGHDVTLSLHAPAAGSTLKDSTEFTWQTVPDALNYQVSLFDAEGRQLPLGATVTSPPWRLIDADSAMRARVVAWRVEVTTLDGRRVQSAMQPLNSR